MSTTSSNKRVLAIQSHVVSGYVGNKSAVFPMQVLGFDVDPINSVQFSNHTGYGSFKGSKLNGDELIELINGLEANSLLSSKYSHIITGYIGTVSFAESITSVIERTKSVNSNLIYVCDPVMGDYDRKGKSYKYVEDGLLPVYQSKILPLADIITPNQFELEQLLGIKITSEEGAISAMESIRTKYNISIVILTSTHFTSSDSLIMYATNGKDQLKLTIPRLDFSTTGTGDLTTALILAYTTIHPNDLSLALEKSVATVSAVLQRTFNYYNEQYKHNPEDPKDRVKKVAAYEIRLIQSLPDIMNPNIKIKATKI